jgi:hypothetical protein
MSSKLANKASHPSGRKAMQAVRASHKEERMKMHKLGEGRRSAQPTFASAFQPTFASAFQPTFASAFRCM